MQPMRARQLPPIPRRTGLALIGSAIPASVAAPDDPLSGRDLIGSLQRHHSASAWRHVCQRAADSVSTGGCAHHLSADLPLPSLTMKGWSTNLETLSYRQEA